MTRVLITRPLEASLQLAEQLKGLGLTPIVMPFYRFAALPSKTDFNTDWSSAGRKLAVFTSPRAVEFGLPLIPDDVLPGLQFAVVGAASAAALQAAGYPHQLQAKSGYTSEDLLDIPELHSEPGKAVIFCAPGGRQTLATGLHNLGWEVTRAEVYERIAQQPNDEQLDDLANATRLLSIWTSTSALTLAQQHLPAELWEKVLQAPALVISNRIQHHLVSLGATSVALSNGPGNAELLEAIMQMPGIRNSD